jgi:inhibitor of cysteine peptidase
MTTIKLDIHSSGRSIAAAPGDCLQLQLDENPSTGFRWNVEDDGSGVLVLEHDAFIRTHNDAIGAGGVRELQFAVAKPGQTTLRVSNRRSWESQKPPHATFELTVTVQERPPVPKTLT